MDNVTIQRLQSREKIYSMVNELILYSLALAVIVTTITRGSIFKEARKKIPVPFLKKLFNCPYCLAHWFAIPLGLHLGDPILIFALIAISSLPTFFLIKYLRWLDVN